jgi:hypothetical protein
VDPLIGIAAVVLVAVVVIVVSAPLRAAGGGSDELSAELGELDAAREAKYREIRDAELDFRTGKLSREDYRAVDAVLRAEALEILDRVQAHDDASAD